MTSIHADIRTGLIGCGYWGPNLARNFARLGALACVCDRNAKKAESLAARLRVTCCDWRIMLADPTIDAIAIATPAPSHAPLAREALLAGKHVYVEKPFALSLADAETLATLADAQDRRLMVGHLLRYHPCFTHLLDLARKNTFGALRYVYSNRIAPGIILTQENALWALAPHDLAMVLALAGEPPVGVHAHGSAFINPGNADWTTLHLTFPSGLNAHVHSSWAHPFKEQRLVLVGEKACAVFEDSQKEWSRKLALYPDWPPCKADTPATSASSPLYPEIPCEEPLFLECRHFLACIAEGEAPLTGAEEGLAVTRILETAQTSLSLSASRPAPAAERPSIR